MLYYSINTRQNEVCRTFRNRDLVACSILWVGARYLPQFPSVKSPLSRRGFRRTAAMGSELLPFFPPFSVLNCILTLERGVGKCFSSHSFLDAFSILGLGYFTNLCLFPHRGITIYQNLVVSEQSGTYVPQKSKSVEKSKSCPQTWRRIINQCCVISF